LTDNLTKYRSKRDFKQTREPSGEIEVKASNRCRFVI
jgi:bifunctional non-homologous end joining protein LigD